MGNPATNRVAPEASEGEAEALRERVERTLPTAYSLALRICGNAEQAAAACEASYREWPAWDHPEAGWSGRDEARFLSLVRTHALAAKRQRGESSGGDGRPYDPQEMGLRALQATDPLGARAVELAYFGGLNAASIAELLGESTDDVRTAMRRALLSLAQSGRAEGGAAR